MIEPIYIAQSAESLSDEDGRRWFADRAKDVRDRGCKHGRFSTHPDIPNLRLVEGWDKTSREVFADGGEGEQRWALSASPRPRTPAQDASD